MAFQMISLTAPVILHSKNVIIKNMNTTKLIVTIQASCAPIL